MRARRRRGRRPDHDQACVAVSRRHPRRQSVVRPDGCRVQRLRRVRHDQGGCERRLDCRPAGRARIAGLDQACGRRPDRLVLDEGPAAMALGADKLLRTRSALYKRALELIPGGVNSPVRAMRAVGLDEPFFVSRGEGAYLVDVAGNHYLDWVLSWGPLLFGHADPETVDAVREAALLGTTFGATTEA